MINEITDNIAVEELVKAQFGLQVDVKQMIAQDIPVSHTAVATVFLTPKHQVFALIRAQSPLTYGEVKKMAKKMGLEVSEVVPPGHDTQYFRKLASEKFREVFPGRTQVSDDDLRYYTTLVPYNPALLRVESIAGGVIKQFDSHDSSEWRVAARFAYKQIKAL